VAALEENLDKKASTREKQLGMQVKALQAELEDFREQQRIDEDVKKYLAESIRSLEVESAANETERGVQISQLRQELHDLRQQLKQARCVSMGHPWRLFQLGASSIPVMTSAPSPTKKSGDSEPQKQSASSRTFTAPSGNDYQNCAHSTTCSQKARTTALLDLQ